MESLLGLWLGLIVTGGSMVVFFALGRRGWTGKLDDCVEGGVDICYCEKLRPGMVKQPSNTWSNLAFVLVGLLILIHAGGAQAEGQNPMTTIPFYSIGFGIVIITVGLGSIFFHGSMTSWGNLLDNLGMYWFLSFALLYDLFRLFNASNVGVFIVIFLFFNVFVGILRGLNEGSEKYVFPTLLVSLIVIEFLFALGVIGVAGVERSFSFWFAAELGALILAVVIWRFSRTDEPLCNPDWPIQGHAVWQVLAAVAGGFLYLNLIAEVVS
jgi:hypothetical protein